MDDSMTRREILRRGAIAGRLFGWSSAHLEGFEEGVYDAMALPLPVLAAIPTASLEYGFDVEEIVGPDMEKSLPASVLRDLGRREAFKAVRCFPALFVHGCRRNDLQGVLVFH